MQSGKMKALMKKDGAFGAVLTEVPIPEIDKHEVLIKVKVLPYAARISTFIIGINGHVRESKHPMFSAMSSSGIVEDVGENVISVKVGEYVSAETHIVCGECVPCLTGKSHVCTNTAIIGVDTAGCFAEYVKVPADNIWRNPADMDPSIASIQEPLGNAVHTVLECQPAGGTTAVIGCGPIGLMAVAVAKATGASQVIAIDKNEYRLRLAKQMGATCTVSIEKEDPLKIVSALTSGEGADLVCEMSGHPSAIAQGLAMAANGGRFHILSLPEHPVTIDLTNKVVFKGLTIQGITGRKMFSTWRQVSQLISSNVIDLEPVITHQFPLEEFEKGFELMRSGQCGKVILIP